MVPIGIGEIDVASRGFEGSPSGATSSEASSPAIPAISDRESPPGSVLPIALALAAIVILVVAIRRQWWRLRDEVGPTVRLRGDLSLIAFAAMILAGGIGAGLAVRGEDGSLARIAWTMGGLAAGQLLAAAPFLWLLREAAHHPRDASLGGAILAEDRTASSTGRSLLLGLGAMAFAYPVIATLGQIASLVETAIRGELPDPVAHDTLRALVEGGGFATAAGLAISVLVVTAIPCCEEIAYRGLLQPAIGRGIGWFVQRGSGTPAGSAGSRWLAIGLTSIAFSLMHLSALPEASRGAALVTLAAVSILLGWLYERSGRLWAPIAAHGLFNAINLAIALLPA